MSRESDAVFDDLVAADSGWSRVQSAGKLNVELRDKMVGRSGCYAFRETRGRKCLYVGESHTDRLWKTMLRHTHARESFERQDEVAIWADRETVQIRYWISDPDAAIALECRLIQILRPTLNKTGCEGLWTTLLDGTRFELPPF